VRSKADEIATLI